MTQATSTDQPTGTVLSRAMRPLNTVIERIIPSALTFAIVLTLVVMVLAWVLTGTPLISFADRDTTIAAVVSGEVLPPDIITAWGQGLSGLLAFITQIALVLLLGHALAHTRPAARFFKWVSSLPKTPMAAYLLVFGVAAVANLFSWGLGLVVGALLAVQVAKYGRRNGLRLHFPMLVAAGFSANVLWHMGYSGSAPLSMTDPNNPVAAGFGGTIPLSETTYAGWNLVAVVLVAAAVTLAIVLVAPREKDLIAQMPDTGEDAAEEADEVLTPADRIDASRILTTVLGVLVIVFIIVYFVRGGAMDINMVNWTFLALLLLVKGPFELSRLVRNAAANVGEILLQFPLYAGIMGIMSGTGLIQILSDAIVSVASPATFGLLAVLSAGIVNVFVPSGGGQFAVQGPVLLDAAGQLGVDPAIPVMAIAYGDAWTNMIQPFWAIPVLAIAGLKIRDILGYTTVTLFASGAVFLGVMLYLGLTA